MVNFMLMLNASRTMLYNINKLDWDDELLKIWINNFAKVLNPLKLLDTMSENHNR